MRLSSILEMLVWWRAGVLRPFLHNTRRQRDLEKLFRLFLAWLLLLGFEHVRRKQHTGGGGTQLSDGKATEKTRVVTRVNSGSFGELLTLSHLGAVRETANIDQLLIYWEKAGRAGKGKLSTRFCSF